MDDKITNANTPHEVTGAMIDSMIAGFIALSVMDLSHPQVEQKLKDLRGRDDVKRIMDIGELSDARDKIKNLEKEMAVLLSIFGLLTTRDIQWEHRIQRYACYDEDKLNKIGKDGWQLAAVHCEENSDHYCYYFRRPKKISQQGVDQ